MKQKLLQKIMLLLFALIAGSTSVWADDPTEEILATQFGFTSNTNLTGDNATLSATNFTLTFAQNESTNPPVYNSSNEEFRLYKIASGKTSGATITIASKDASITFNKIVFNFSNLPTNYSFSSGSYDTETKTWTGDATTSLTITNTDFSGQLKIKSMTITYAASSSYVATPSFLPAAGAVEKGTSVTISTATDGASIYYTTNGSTPTSGSTPYSGALTINNAQTIKAIAIKGDNSSEVATAEYTIKKVDTPTFSVAEGVVLEGTLVELSTTTDGASIYYTTNGAEPTSSSTLYDAPIEIDENMTIKAIAVKTNWDDSDVANAAYTVVAPIYGLSIDFEANNVSRYVDWVFDNIGTHSTGITAHAGSYWGANVNSSDNGTSSASITTKAKIAHPGIFTCYISKESSNTSTSTWKVQVSNDGSDWTVVKSFDATDMTKGIWTKVSADLSAYSDVYVRLYYTGSNAKRAVDDITLTDAVTITLASACTDGEGKYYGTYSNSKAFVVPADLTVSEVSIVDGKLYVEDYNTGDVVPANTGVMVSSNAAGDHTVALTAETGTSVLASDNMLKPSGDAGISAANMNVADTKFYRLTMHNGTTIGFWWGAADGAAFDLAANKAYLAVPNSAMTREGFWFDDTTGIQSIDNGQKIKDNAIYDLSGRRVENPTKGIYIMNGKKVIFK